MTLTRAGTSANPIRWIGAAGHASIIDPTVTATSGWTEDLSLGKGVYKKSFAYRPGVLIADGYCVPEMRDLPYANYINLAADATVYYSNFAGSVKFWDGVEAAWAWDAGTAYVRFRDRSNANGHSLRVSDTAPPNFSGEATGPAPLKITSGSYNQVSGFTIRGGFYPVILAPTTGTLTGCVIESNVVNHGYGQIYLRDKVVSNTVRFNIVSPKAYYESAGTYGGAWGYNVAATGPDFHVYQFSKSHWSQGDESALAIRLYRHGDNNVISGNVISNGSGGISITGLLADQPQNTRVESNAFYRLSSAGVLTLFCDLTHIRDNAFERTQYSVRPQSIGAARTGPSRMYIYRNTAWNPANRGFFIYIHGAAGDTFKSEIWCYHNSYEGGYGGISISSLITGQTGGIRFLNNIICSRNTITEEYAVGLGAFDYNLISEIANPGAWYGSHNIVPAPIHYEWGGSAPSANAPDFLIDTTSRAWNAATNLARLALPETRSGAEFNAWDIGAYELEYPSDDEATPVDYTLTVNNGLGTGSYSAGSSIDLVAASAPSGQVFDRWTGDVGTVANVNAATTTMTMPADDTTVTATYRAVSAGGTFSFLPTDDAYLQGTTRFNDAYLKVEAGNRVAYLKFNISGLSGSVRSATLQLRENGDLGSGTLRVYRGSHNSWTETSLTAANAPSASGQVGTSSGSVSAAQIVNINVTSLIPNNGTYTAIIKMDAGGNDIWFGSEESARKPRLIVETGGSAASAYTLTVNNGSGSGSYAAGTTLNLVAASAPSGQVFDRWTGDVGTVANVNTADDDDDDAGRQCHGDGDVSGGQRRWDIHLRADGRRLPAGDDAVQ